MKTHDFGRLALSFLVAVLFAVVWGAVVQTQYNLQGLASLGVDVSGVRWSTTARDVFSGFTPTYGGYVVAPALLVAFLAAGWISRRSAPLARALWFALAGLLAVWVAIPLVNWLAPVALLVGASRDAMCTFLMAVGGGVAGLLFAWMTRHRRRHEPQPMTAPLEPDRTNPLA
ncbi:hypothetical protein [Pseudoxanthomonas suwonensis]|uniref:hypothetical protein n=1 Tax=Pseudoxanthomonas suwonensis TaxID=314722 RepID=UPI0006975F54|nr:hypothetical protein [Pseudoxanthomonas suwonensis]